MAHHIFDIGPITRAIESLSLFTGLKFSLYDDRANPIIEHVGDDPFLSSIKANKVWRDLYNGFIDKNLKVVRRSPFLVKGPTYQYHAFIPIEYKQFKGTLLTDAFYTSIDDFRGFYNEYGAEIGLPEKGLEEWLNQNIFPLDRIQLYLSHIMSYVETLISLVYEKEEISKRYQWSRSILRIISDLKCDMSMDDIYRTIIDTVVFLFNVDTAALLLEHEGVFTPKHAVGRSRDTIMKLSLSEKNSFILRVRSSGTPVSSTERYQLWHVGFPEDITSMYLFPVTSDNKSFGILGIFNTLLNKEVFEFIHELCKLSALICGSLQVINQFTKKSEALDQSLLKISQMYSLSRNPQYLFDTIVKELSGLLDAEKCSLMLPEDDVLNIRAVSGVSRSLMDGIKVGKGQGIAGKVFEDGTPIIINNEEGFKTYSVSPKPLFKTASCLSLPLKINGDVIGVVNLSDKRSGASFSQEDLSAIKPFAFQVAMLLKIYFYKEMAEQMRELSITDSLTQLYNRRYFDIRIEEEFQRAKRHGMYFSLAIVDIDDFKLFNDKEGHLAGDYILREIASIMSSTIRANDILVRFGGEEFAIIMPQTSIEEALHVSERVRQNVKKMIPCTWKNFPRKNITVSIGIANYPDYGKTVENLIRRADIELYKAKMYGKDRTLSPYRQLENA